MVQFRAVGFIVGILLCTLALAMLVPAMFDLADGNRDWRYFILGTAATGIAGGFPITACWPDLALEVKDAFVLTAASWVVVPAFAALPPGILVRRSMSR